MSKLLRLISLQHRAIIGLSHGKLPGRVSIQFFIIQSLKYQGSNS